MAVINGVWRAGLLVCAVAGVGCAMFGGRDAGSTPSTPTAVDGQADSVVRCVSRDNRRKYCAADTDRGIRMVRQLSAAECIQGSTWGYDARGIWVVSGCGGEFVAVHAADGDSQGGAGDAAPVGEQIVRCESRGNRRSRCNAVVGEGVELIRQLSRTRCVQRQNWGWDRRGVWVDGNCGAEFRVY